MQDVQLTLPHLFDRAERLFADKEVISPGRRGLERTTYGAWASRTRRLGGALAELGVDPDGRVGTFAWNTSRHLELYFAAPCTGRVLHTLNIRLFPEQLAYVVNHAADQVIFVDRSLLGLLGPVLDGLETVRHLVVMDDGGEAEPDVPSRVAVHDYEQLVAAAGPADFVVEDERRAASMCYTSGTTGKPKGVVYSHRSTVLHSFATMMTGGMAIEERDRVLPIVPMFHANAWGLPYGAVATGASLVMPGSDLSGDAVAELIEAERVTVAAGVPTVWMGALAALKGRDTSALRMILCGGSAVPPSLSEAYRSTVGLPILQAWGMTETSPMGSMCHLKSTLADRASDEELAELRATVGRLVPGVEARIVDPDSGDEAPWDGNAIGELQVRGPWVASGYYNDDRSSESFTGDGWLRTGDVATIDPHGYIRLVDRTKDLVKSGGEWISSVDLENAIMAHPSVAEAAVIGVAHPRWGERPLACIVPHPGETVAEDELRDFLADRLPKWWLPDAVELVDEIPKTSVGKFSKRELRERFTGYELPGVGGAEH